MRSYFQAVYQAITEVSPHEMVGGLLVGLTLSLAVAGICMLGRKKVADPFPFLCGLILLVSALSMTFGLGHSRYQATRSIQAPSGFGPRAKDRFSSPSNYPIGHRLIQEADADGDGRLTPQEAAEYIRRADLSGKGWADSSEIDKTPRGWAGARPPQGPPADSPRRGF